LEGNVHDHDAPPNGELAMLGPHEVIIILIFPLDPWPPWGTLNEFQSSINHYIHQVWHTLPSPSPCSLMDVNNGPPSLSPLYTKIFQWDIPKDGICLLKSFGNINLGLATILQSRILVRKYHYVEKDPQAKEASMWHVMMLQQKYPHLLPTLAIHGY
jgi:hypothetical protein